MKKTLRRLSAFCMSALLLLATAIPASAAGEEAPPSEIESCAAYFMGNDFKITFEDTEGNHAWVSAITSITVENEKYEKAMLAMFVDQNKQYYTFSSSVGSGDPPSLIIGEGAFEEDTAECIIEADGYSDLTLELDKSNHSATIKTSADDGNDGSNGDDTDEPVIPPTGNAAPPSDLSCTSDFGADFKITLKDTSADHTWISAISSVTVAGTEYTQVNSYYSVHANNYYLSFSEPGSYNVPYLLIDDTNIDGTAECIIKADGYSDLVLELNKTDHTATIKTSGGDTPDPEECEHTGGTATCLNKAVCDICYKEYGELGDHNYEDGECTVCGDKKQSVPTEITVTIATPDPSDLLESYYIILQATGADDYVSDITSILHKDTAQNVTTLEQTSQKWGVSGKNYYLDETNNKIYFNNLPNPFKSGEILTIQTAKYGDLSLKITINGSDITLKPVTGDEDPGDNLALHVRLVGYFEAAIVGQKDYDAITGASNNVNVNKNSNVVVQAALVEKDTEPEESDWKLLHESGITIDTQNTKINMANDFGMAGVYSPYDSSITLGGTPNTAGTYPISITLTDNQGRTAESNALVFKVYTGYEYLEDQLILDNCTKAQDGKYMYDMEPWAMVNFCETAPQVVTVPKDIKAWYGSHTSGTYGELGYAVSHGTVPPQTLIIPSGCNLTLVNMDILSSVRIVVENGGKLVLRDSVVQGIIEVNEGGTFSMNYNDMGEGEFLTGASINGQLILNDGATLENAKIYSHTNYIANGDEARNNTDPVVVVNGTVNLKGQVFIRGDEAPTNPSIGQSGLTLTENSRLNLTEGSVLAVYGGGNSALSSNGGTAIILEDGSEIAGKGTLIAVGGSGSFGNGGTAVDGSGTISTANAYLEGGNTLMPAPTGPAGAAKADTVNVTSPNQKLIAGQANTSDPKPTYWNNPGGGELPDLNQYFEGIDTPTPPVEETQYTITFDANNGSGDTKTQTVSTTSTSATATLDANSFTRSKYRFTGWNTEADGTGTSYANGASIEISDNITLYAQWKRKSSSSGSSSSSTSATQYAVELSDSKNGSVSVSPKKAEKGTTITLTVTPNEGYALSKLKVTDQNDNSVKLTEKNNGKYTFTMPASVVTVKATFAKAEETPAATEEVKSIILTINQKVANVFGELVVNDVAPIIRNDRTMLPIRFVAEALGATVEWNDSLNAVTITKGDLTMEIFIGSPFAQVNGEPVALDAPAFIENSRTYLPLRFIAENLGATVTWNQETQQVTITPNA